MQTYVPTFSSRLTRIVEADPALASGCEEELFAAATRLADPDRGLTVYTGCEPLRRLDCVGVTSSATSQPCADEIKSALQVFPIAKQVIEAYKSNSEMLGQVEEVIRSNDKERFNLVPDHRDLVTGMLGGVCLLVALMEKKILDPGDIKLVAILGTTTKFLNYHGVPIAQALTQEGIIQYVDYVVPQTDSTRQSPSLERLQADFNTASMFARARRASKNKEDRIANIVYASGTTDKLISVGGKDVYIMAPAAKSAGLLIGTACLNIGLGIEPDGEAAIYMGSVTRPETADDVDAMMTQTSIGMTAVSRTPSIYIRDAEQYARIVDSKSLKAAA